MQSLGRLWHYGIVPSRRSYSLTRVRWPDRFHRMIEGEDCPICAEGRPEQTADGVRFFAGNVADAYLRRRPIQRGLSVVIWRGRHVVEPTDLDDDEAVAFLREVRVVGRAITAAFSPIKLNYNILGNAVPHLHVHIVPRYADDPRPGWPFPFPEREPSPEPVELMRADLEALQSALAR